MVKKPSGNKRRHNNRNFIRKNDKIRAREVRVIGHDGEMLGVMPPEEALKIAKSHGLDLVEVASSANPPVCRILEFGKYKYELSKNKRNWANILKGIKADGFDAVEAGPGVWLGRARNSSPPPSRPLGWCACTEHVNPRSEPT